MGRTQVFECFLKYGGGVTSVEGARSVVHGQIKQMKIWIE